MALKVGSRLMFSTRTSTVWVRVSGLNDTRVDVTLEDNRQRRGEMIVHRPGLKLRNFAERLALIDVCREFVEKGGLSNE